MRVTVKLSDQNMKDIETQLDGIRKPQSAVKTAVNNASKKVQRNLANKASKRYAGPIARQGAILAKSDIKKASAAGQQATIIFKSPVYEPRDFRVLGVTLDSGKIAGRKLTKAGKAAKIRIGVLKGSTKEVKGAFLVQFKSGHVAIATRVPGEYYDRDKTSESPKKGLRGVLDRLIKRKKQKTLKGTKHNEKVRAFYSPSYMKAIGNKKVYDPDEIAEILNEEVEKVIAKALKGAKNGK